MLPPGYRYPWVPSKNVSHFVPAVRPAIAYIHTNIYMREELYQIEDYLIFIFFIYYLNSFIISNLYLVIYLAFSLSN